MTYGNHNTQFCGENNLEKYCKAYFDVAPKLKKQYTYIDFFYGKRSTLTEYQFIRINVRTSELYPYPFRQAVRDRDTQTWLRMANARVTCSGQR